MDNQNDNINNTPNDSNSNQTPPVNPNVPQTQQAHIQPQQPTPNASDQTNQQQAYTQPSPQNQTAVADDPGKVFGIISIITAIAGFHLVAIILGIVGLNKSKKAGFPRNTLALIGIIWSVVAMIIVSLLIVAIVMNNFQGAQSKGRDTVSKNDINSTYQKLEEYYNFNGSYPAKFTAETLPGIDAGALTDTNGNTFSFGDSSITNSIEAEAQSLPTKKEMYQYLPFNCFDDSCNGFIIRTYLEEPDTFTSLNLYTKYGINNF